VFFLGLLSTPLPYLLLAAFYFFGFAMGMFNNSNGEETIETISSVTIPVEVKQKTTEQTAYYYQINPVQNQNQLVVLIDTNNSTSFYFPDPGTVFYPLSNIKVLDYKHSEFRFSRPPPSV
jgi:predicted P-loop ATPase/GTPase